MLARRNLGMALAALFVISQPASADFIKDSSGSLTTRNFYINRDFRQDNAPQSKAEEWAQGFILDLQSGYTQGVVGLGVDVFSELGVKLDSGAGRRGTGLLPYGPDSMEPVDNYSEAGLTAKMRFAKSELKVGTLRPTLPLAYYNDMRLLPSTFSGGLLTSKDIEDLTFTAGRLTKGNGRDSSSNDDVGYAGQKSNHLDIVGGDYALTKNLTLRYYHGELNDIYVQQFGGLIHTWSLSKDISLRSDVRYFDSRDTGNAEAGRIDNRNLNGLFTLGIAAHKFSIGYQRLTGDTAFPIIETGTPYVANLVTFNAFTKLKETSWQARYVYDFAEMGVPGLTFMTRYVKGTGIHSRAITDGTEWERDTDISYVIQSGTLKGLDVRWRNATFRSGNGLTQALDENRLIAAYTWKLW
ncbi:MULTISPECIES: OprD family porin [unclassified Pseudomonas]|uniref:OprD family porin n=2 Tax=Pseudomonas TaxID=286 RepID=UPI000694F915|nr:MULTISPECIES: OprD family porin [unclassified Pseudomonas]MBD0686599.1 outer membrane porin, OprD family [Pseudomonas sp. PSB18]